MGCPTHPIYVHLHEYAPIRGLLRHAFPLNAPSFVINRPYIHLEHGLRNPDETDHSANARRTWACLVVVHQRKCMGSPRHLGWRMGSKKPSWSPGNNWPHSLLRMSPLVMRSCAQVSTKADFTSRSTPITGVLNEAVRDVSVMAHWSDFGWGQRAEPVHYDRWGMTTRYFPSRLSDSFLFSAASSIRWPALTSYIRLALGEDEGTARSLKNPSFSYSYYPTSWIMGRNWTHIYLNIRDYRARKVCCLRLVTHRMINNFKGMANWSTSRLFCTQILSATTFFVWR